MIIQNLDYLDSKTMKKANKLKSCRLYLGYRWQIAISLRMKSYLAESRNLFNFPDY